ncbi:hypothetical protein HAX54_027659 [Datura stramonium]|uniref:Uncharacterized protein n=1 Tax=Datura stramonium TaxID=4076 RepID=A0ABS8V429_DATST|nr:hypothetical protein [Datura stramonium]
MAPKVNKGKGLASSSHGSKRTRTISEEEHEDVSMAPPPLRRYSLRWVTKKEVFPHMADRILTLGLDFMFNAPGDCNFEYGERIPCKLDAKGKKPPYRNIRHTLCGSNSVARWTRHQQLGYHVSLPYAHLSREGRDIEEEEANYRPAYHPRGVDVTKTKEPDGINGPVLTVNERNVQIDNMLSHLYGMQMLQLRMNGVTEEQLQQLNIDYPLSEHSRALCRVGPGYEEPLDDDVATEDEMARRPLATSREAKALQCCASREVPAFLALQSARGGSNTCATRRCAAARKAHSQAQGAGLPVPQHAQGALHIGAMP